MPEKLPYFPFYAQDFSADAKVEAMTTQEVGAYMLLLCKAWFEEPVGSIPTDDTVLARWARLDPDAWARCRPSVLSCFRLGTDGRYHQKRMRNEYAKLRAVRKAKSEGGRKSAAKRLKNSTCDASSQDSSKTLGKTLGNKKARSESESVSSSSGKGGAGGKGEPPGFAAFWAAYPLKKAKADALKAWAKLRPGEPLLAAILSAVERQKRSDQWTKDGGEFIPYPATWLNGRRWEDEEQAGLFPAGPTMDPAARVRQMAEERERMRRRAEGGEP